MQSATGFTGGSYALPAGTLLQGGRYRIERTLGQGGFAITYLAYDTALQRPVALKELMPDGCIRDAHSLRVQPQRFDTQLFTQVKARFLDEARLLAQLNHPNIVRVYDLFEANDTGYIVMEYLEGQTLAQLVQARGGVMPEQEAVAYILQVCDALQLLHSRGYLHRDIKPSNIIVTRDGRAVLIDFGAARAFAAGQTQAHTVALTPAYAPLEQYGVFGRFDARTDIYALGATLYYLVTGTPPLSAPDRAQGLPLPAPHLVEPRVSEEVSRAILWAMGLQMDERPADVQAWAQALKAAVGRSPASVSAGSGAPPPPSAAPTPQPQPTPAQGQPPAGQAASPKTARLGIVISAVAIFAILLLAILAINLGASKQQARQLLKEALETAQLIEDSVSRNWALTAIAKAQAQAGLFDAALQTAQMIGDTEDRAKALAAIAQAQAQAGQIETARATFTQALQTAQLLAPPHHAWPLAAIAKAQTRAGLFDDTLRTAQMIIENSYYLHADLSAWPLAEIVKALAQVGQIDAALQTAQMIENIENTDARADARVRALAEIAKAQVQAGQIETACATFTQALQTAKKIKDSFYRAPAFAVIAHAQAQAGLLVNALQTVQMIEDSDSPDYQAGLRVEALAEIAKAQAQAGQIETARATFTQALQTAKKIKDSFYRAPAFAVIAHAQAQMGQFDEAIQTAQKIEKDTFWSFCRPRALREIAKAQAKVGRAKDALKWVRQLLDPEDCTWALIGVAEGILGIEEDE